MRREDFPVNSKVHFRTYKPSRPADSKEYKGIGDVWIPGRRTIFYKESEKAGEFLITSLDVDETQKDAVSILDGFREGQHPLTYEVIEALMRSYKFRDIKFLDSDIDSQKPSNLF